MIVYFDTDDIDASVARVRELGGTSGEATDPPRRLVRRCTDTEGNDFSLFQRDDSVSA